MPLEKRFNSLGEMNVRDLQLHSSTEAAIFDPVAKLAEADAKDTILEDIETIAAEEGVFVFLSHAWPFRIVYPDWDPSTVLDSEAKENIMRALNGEDLEKPVSESKLISYMLAIKILFPNQRFSKSQVDRAESRVIALASNKLTASSYLIQEMAGLKLIDTNRKVELSEKLFLAIESQLKEFEEEGGLEDYLMTLGSLRIVAPEKFSKFRLSENFWDEVISFMEGLGTWKDYMHTAAWGRIVAAPNIRFSEIEGLILDAERDQGSNVSIPEEREY